MNDNEQKLIEAEERIQRFMSKKPLIDAVIQTFGQFDPTITSTMGAMSSVASELLEELPMPLRVEDIIKSFAEFCDLLSRKDLHPTIQATLTNVLAMNLIERIRA